MRLWDILARLGYQADGLYLGLGIDGGINYSHESQRLAEKFADEHNLKLHVVDIEKEYGQSIPVLVGDLPSRTWQAVRRVRTGETP